MMNSLLALMTFGLLLSAEPTKNDDKAVLQGLRARWTEAMQTLRIPGMAVVIVRGDEVMHIEAMGLRDPVGNKPVTPDTLFYIASCTKPFTATLVAKLAEAGKIDLDAPVKRYLPRFKISDEQLTEKLTVRDLLSHRQGLQSRSITFLEAYTGEITDDRLYHFLKTVKPTKKYAYSNLHFTLAGRVVEAVEGKGWREVMDERLFRPAGMLRTTSYASKMYSDPDVAIPLETQGEGWIPCAVRKTDRIMHAAGGTGTTARDLGRWLRLSLNQGEIDGTRVVAEETLKQMRVQQVATLRKTPIPDYQIDGIGLAWELASYKGHQVVRHRGGYDGTSALIAYMPDKKIGVAVLMNAGGAVQDFPEIVVLDVFNRLLGIDGVDMLKPMMAQIKKPQTAAGSNPVPISVKNVSLPLETYVGTFTNEQWGTLRIENKESILLMKIGDLPVLTKSTAPDALQLRSEQTWKNSRFVLEDKHVMAVVVNWDSYGDIRFERKAK